MPKYDWPKMTDRQVIGKRISRVDGNDKVTGKAKYNSDVNLPGMLYAKFLRCPFPHARVTSIDISEAEQIPGVKAVKVIQGPGKEIHWALDDIAVVAAVDEATAEDAIRQIKVQYEKLPHLVNEDDPQKAGNRLKEPSQQTKGNPDQAFLEADVVIEGEYGIPVITHCCLEPHGQVIDWKENSMTVYQSTQNVSGTANQYSQPLETPASNIRVIQDYNGGGVGSKFSADSWGLETAQLAKKTGRPVRNFLERDAELFVAGTRPSGFAKIKVGARKDGTLTAWQADSWGTSGLQGGGVSMQVLPYVINPPNVRKKHTGIGTNTGAARAWRAPNHPQTCWLTFAALDDLAAKLNIDPLDFYRKNLNLTERPDLYEKQLEKAAELMGWQKKWHPRGSQTGPIKQGLGLAFHTWGGRGHDSTVKLLIDPDGSVSVSLATQDIGTGTLTVIAMVVAETFGLPVSAIKVNTGRSPEFPRSGPSGGSTTVGGVCAATRRASQLALEEFFPTVAPILGVKPTMLEARAGKIQVKGNPFKNISWNRATRQLGVTPLEVTGKNISASRRASEGKLIDSGVGGVQMAEVTVDTETGVVRMKKFVAIQDCGLIINEKLAESQVYGAMIMGISSALTEERIMDETTGTPLNGDMEFYKLPGIGDIGELVVHMWKDKEQDSRGVIGLGEPPVIAPVAAIGNAVANAIGIRVPRAPFIPRRVLAALEKKGGLYT